MYTTIFATICVATEWKNAKVPQFMHLYALKKIVWDGVWVPYFLFVNMAFKPESRTQNNNSSNNSLISPHLALSNLIIKGENLYKIDKDFYSDKFIVTPWFSSLHIFPWYE